MRLNLLRLASATLAVSAMTFSLAIAGEGSAAPAGPGGPGSPGGPGGPGGGAPMPPVPVTAAPVEKKPMPVELSTFGTVEANATVSIKPQVTGVIKEVLFKEGQAVKKGDKLFTLDSRPFVADQERAAAQFLNAKTELERQEQLDKTGGTTKSTLDLVRTALVASKAALDLANLNVEYCNITSPIDGRVGACLVDAGNMVKSGDVALVVINQVQPIQLGFSVPQVNLAEIKKRMAEGKLMVSALIPGQADAESGEVVFVDNAVDRLTGTIKLKAEFPNAAERLWPGQFVTIKVVLKVEPDAIVVPSKAVQNGQQGLYVFVITQDMKPDKRSVTVSREVGEFSVISSGTLQPGEQVVTDGQFRITPKSTLSIKEPEQSRGAGKPDGSPEGGKSEKAGKGDKGGKKPEGAAQK